MKGAAAGVAVPYIVPCWAVGKGSGSTGLAEVRPAPSNRITLGLIGLGSMGMRHVQGFLQKDDFQILAVCDVDAARRAEAVQQVNKRYGNPDRSGRSAGRSSYCSQYNDFRDLVARNDIDALCISVPDHWHCLCTIMGIRAGKDIYGEKPLALTIAEGQVMVEAVQRYNCVWQTGSWQRSTSHFRFACELVRDCRESKSALARAINQGRLSLRFWELVRSRLCLPLPVLTMKCGWVRRHGRRTQKNVVTGTSDGYLTIPAARSPIGALIILILRIGAWVVTRRAR